MAQATAPVLDSTRPPVRDSAAVGPQWRRSGQSADEAGTAIHGSRAVAQPHTEISWPLGPERRVKSVLEFRLRSSTAASPVGVGMATRPSTPAARSIPIV
jgi:hypothetical protein